MERECYRLGDLTVDVGAASVTRDHDGSFEESPSLRLPRLSFDLLVLLVRQAPDVVTPDELIAKVWRETAVADETVTQRVALLRRALGDNAKNPIYIRSVRGRGYQLVPKVETCTPSCSDATSVEDEKRRPSRVLAFGLAVALSALALSLGGWLAYQGSRADGVGDASLPTRHPDVSELMERAETYLRRQQKNDNKIAIELFEKALALEPDQPDALAGLSLALSHRVTKFERSTEAIERATLLAQRAVHLAPGLARAHQALGLALDSRGRMTQAVEAYNRAYEIDSRRTDALASAAYSLQIQGHLAKALEANVRVLRSGDKPTFLEVQMGATLGLLGFNEEAQIWFDRALTLRPNNVFAAVGRARILFSAGQFDEARKAAEAGLARGVQRPELSIIRGDVAWRKGDLDSAADAYREAMSLQPELDQGTTRIWLLQIASTGEPSTTHADTYGKKVTAIRDDRAKGNEWPQDAIEEAGLHAAFDNWNEALDAIDVAIDLGFRDAGSLLHHPILARHRDRPGFHERLERIHQLVQADRQRVLEADWLPATLLSAYGSSANR